MSAGAEAQISLVPPHEQAAALELVFAQLAPDARRAQVAGLLAAERSGKLSLSGLLAARRGGGLVGAEWAQVQAGGSAGVWPPRLVHGEPATTADALLSAAIDLLARGGAHLAQALLPDDAAEDRGRFAAAGFAHLADLEFLVSLARSFPATAPEGLEFESVVRAGQPRLARVMEATYEDTLDCPALNGLRQIEDVLEEYRGIGVHDPAQWLVARCAGTDVGCLLLADHPEIGQWELVYMGLVPGARGRGWGQTLVRYAQWLARRAGRQRLVLAVDSRNTPAIDVYAATGFEVFDRRSAYLRVLAPRPPGSPVSMNGPS